MTPRSNSLVDELRRDLCVLVHLADERPNLAVGELVDAVAEQRFVLAELREGVANCRYLLHRRENCLFAACVEIDCRRTGYSYRSFDVKDYDDFECADSAAISRGRRPGVHRLAWRVGAQQAGAQPAAGAAAARPQRR